MTENETLITGDMQVETIMEKYPQTVTYFIMNKVSPISCAGAYPKTLEEMLTLKKVENIQEFIQGLNKFLISNQNE